MLRYQVLPGLPAYGPMAVSFGASSYRVGFVVCFNPDTDESWVGNFQRGCGKWEGVLEHTDGKHAIILARGEGYVVDPGTRGLVQRFGPSIQHAIVVPHLQAIVFCDGLVFEAIRSEGIWWTSQRVSWDGVRVIKIDGTVLRGEAYSVVDVDEWVPFTLDLLTGQCADGPYDRVVRDARPASRA